MFDAAAWRSPEEHEEGGRVFAAHSHLNGEIELQFANGAIRFDRIHAGDLLWRTHDPEIDRLARPFLEATTPLARQRVNVAVEAREGEPLHAVWSLEKQPQISVQIDSPTPLDAAQNRGLTLDTLREQFGRLGNTAYELGEVTLDVEGSLFAAVSTLNQMRREAVEKLQAIESRPPHAEIHDPAAALKKFARPTPSSAARHRSSNPPAGPHARTTRSRARHSPPPASRWITSTSTASAPPSNASKPAASPPA